MTAEARVRTQMQTQEEILYYSFCPLLRHILQNFAQCQNSTHKHTIHPWEINHSCLCQFETLPSKPSNPVLKMFCWWQNDSHWHNLNTLSDQQQHTRLLYIKHCSLSFLIFLVSWMEGFFLKLKMETLSLKLLHKSLCYKLKQEYYKHYTTVNREKNVAQWACGSCHLLGSDQRISSTSQTHLLWISAKSIPGLSSPQCLHRPVHCLHKWHTGMWLAAI